MIAVVLVFREDFVRPSRAYVWQCERRLVEEQCFCECWDGMSVDDCHVFG